MPNFKIINEPAYKIYEDKRQNYSLLSKTNSEFLKQYAYLVLKLHIRIYEIFNFLI